MLDLGCPDLAADPKSIRVTKDEVVDVQFAAAPGVLTSAVGLNHYGVGDALLTGSTGDRWCVSRPIFDAKYRSCDGLVAGAPGRYRNIPVVVIARRIDEPFRIARRPGGDVLVGRAGDWAVQYGRDDCGLVAAARFASVYRPLNDPGGRA